MFGLTWRWRAGTESWYRPLILVLSLGLCLGILGETAAAVNPPLILTQWPLDATVPVVSGQGAWRLPSTRGLGTRLVRVDPVGETTLLTAGFAAACDPSLSFDGKRLLFSGKRRAEDPWDVFEMSLADRGLRRITRGLGDCRQPRYLSTFYTIVSPQPWSQLIFARTEPGRTNEIGWGSLTRLYSSKRDGSTLRGLTYGLSSDTDPALLPDGRVVYAGWRRGDAGGRMGLFHMNSDGTDVAAYTLSQGRAFKRMPCVTASGWVVFIESDALTTWDGAGTVGAVRRRRPLHSYRPVTGDADGLFHSPAPLPDGRVLISRRGTEATARHRVGILDPETGQWEPLYEDPNAHCVQAQAIWAQPRPDGRSSVVTETDPHGKLYCLDISLNDTPEPTALAAASRRLRVLEGLVREAGGRAVGPADRAVRRILGEIALAEDGSFQVEVPANTPLELQLLDDDGMALRACSGIWVKNHEPRGCIGCHEDGERTPENAFVGALRRPAVSLTAEAGSRRAVTFVRDVLPILRAKCLSCHGADHARLPLVETPAGPFNEAYRRLLSGSTPYVTPGRARTSPLVWALVGHVTARPWDGLNAPARVRRMPPSRATALTEAERRTIVEWVDLGAAWDLPAAPVSNPQP